MKHTVEISLCDRIKGAEILDAGIACQQIEPTEFRHHTLYQFSGLRHVADVGPEGGQLVPVATQFADQRIGRRLISDVIHGHRGALCGQPPHDRRTDSPATTGHCVARMIPSDFSVDLRNMRSETHLSSNSIVPLSLSAMMRCA